MKIIIKVIMIQNMEQIMNLKNLQIHIYLISKKGVQISMKKNIKIVSLAYLIIQTILALIEMM